MKYLIGLDAGTTTTKAVLFDEKGNELKIVSKETKPIHTQEIYAEQDMDATWESVHLAIKDLIQGIDKNSILGIGVTGQGEGCWLVDNNGQSLSPAIIWMDSRSSDEVDKLYASGVASKIQKLTGNSPQPCNTMMNLLWLSKNDPEKLSNAKYVFFCKDWIKYKLTGVASLDVSDAGTSLLYGDSLKPATEVFDMLGLSQYIHLLPPISNSSDVIGYITNEVAEFTGLKEGTPVIAGCIDVQSCGLGVGAVSKEETYMILGTTCVVNVIISNFTVKNNGSRTIPYGLKGFWTELLPTLSGTPNLDWGRENISIETEFEQVEKEVSKVVSGSGGVVYHPYLAGERTPFYNSNARASFFGINFSTTRAHLLRAIYEGMTFSLADCIKDYQVSKIYLTGGGSQSDLWAQLIADVMNAEVVIKKGSEFGAKGAAILAGLGVGLYKSINDIQEVTNIVEKRFYPDSGHHKIYKELMDLYLSARNTFPPLWEKRDKILKIIKE